MPNRLMRSSTAALLRIVNRSLRTLLILRLCWNRWFAPLPTWRHRLSTRHRTRAMKRPYMDSVNHGDNPRKDRLQFQRYLMQSARNAVHAVTGGTNRTYPRTSPQPLRTNADSGANCGQVGVLIQSPPNRCRTISPLCPQLAHRPGERCEQTAELLPPAPDLGCDRRNAAGGRPGGLGAVQGCARHRAHLSADPHRKAARRRCSRTSRRSRASCSTRSSTRQLAAHDRRALRRRWACPASRCWSRC